MSDLLAIGASGVRAYQGALATTSDNIANAGTAGYVRRTPTLREVAATGSTGGTVQAGVALGLVDRAADAFRSSAVRSSGSELARSETGMVWLDRIEQTLDGSQLSARLGDFFNAGQALAANPAAGAPRAVMLEQAGAVAAAFRATGASLDEAQADIATAAQGAAGELTAQAAALAKVNSAIGRSTGAAPPALLDERDRILESMSALVDVSVSFDAAGRATVKAGAAGGPTLVAGDRAADVGVSLNGQGALQFHLRLDGEVAVIPAQGGTLAGIVDGAQRVADAKASLDELATDFIDAVNAVQAGGEDLNGAAGGPMFAGTDAASMTVALTDGAQIAAATPGAGKQGNGNLQVLAGVRKSGGFEDRLTTLQSATGAAIAARRNVIDAQSAIHDNAVAARDAVSGVNLDEEAVNLLKFQQAYQASARVIQVARETLDSIFAIR
ncbi:flagellar hook-associated protein FlgK [Sphingomonas spermidinifaciens]|uniref:Flagellar hook-associated protein 1 n=1 Tax=Sphingomonas spermidinifaciens TaxID=1141889 RepID=A0A2A4B3H0_9SPHN|nr:flagellar hook-associated protein FlgK [Sphingomonas spermidinifaciens]PCD02492.1 flagellar hook-associated protein FlgK [Sphingomonas spermidinifaciens]